MERWSNKVAVVTGASSGIGEAISRDLCTRNVIVVGLARREDRLIKLGEDILKKTSSARFLPVVCDVTQEDQIKAAFDRVISTFGGVDILVNNAGVITQYAILEEGSDEMINRVIQTNVIGLLSCTKKAYKSMADRDVPGYIVNISSLAGHIVPNFSKLKPFSATYSASKFAVSAINSIVAQELVYYKKPQIRISNISPGLVDTEILLAGGFPNFDHLPRMKSEDIVDALIYILSTPSSVQVRDIVIEPVGMPIF